MAKLGKPSFKQQKFAKAYVKNKGNATQSALESYDTDYAGAHSIAMQNMKKPVVLEEINKILDKTGFNNASFIADSLVKVVNNGIEQKTTTKDALQALNMMLKVSNAYPSNKNTSLKLQLKGNLSQENVSEVIASLKGMSTKSNELIEDII